MNLVIMCYMMDTNPTLKPNFRAICKHNCWDNSIAKYLHVDHRILACTQPHPKLRLVFYF